jgi:hypothetical protein
LRYWEGGPWRAGVEMRGGGGWGWVRGRGHAGWVARACGLGCGCGRALVHVGWGARTGWGAGIDARPAGWRLPDSVVLPSKMRGLNRHLTEVLTSQSGNPHAASGLGARRRRPPPRGGNPVRKSSRGGNPVQFRRPKSHNTATSPDRTHNTATSASDAAQIDARRRTKLPFRSQSPLRSARSGNPVRKSSRGGNPVQFRRPKPHKAATSPDRTHNTATSTPDPAETPARWHSRAVSAAKIAHSCHLDPESARNCHLVAPSPLGVTSPVATRREPSYFTR